MLTEAPTNLTPTGCETREWKLRGTDYRFIQQKNKGNKSWHTGVWKRKLESIACGTAKGAAGDIVVQTRAKHILSKRNLFSKGSPACQDVIPKKTISFFPFEENLRHQINEAKAMISTGVLYTFFENPYVRKTLSDLEPRHRPAHREKFCRVIRCAVDQSDEEVCVYLRETQLST